MGATAEGVHLVGVDVAAVAAVLRAEALQMRFAVARTRDGDGNRAAITSVYADEAEQFVMPAWGKKLGKQLQVPALHVAIYDSDDVRCSLWESGREKANLVIGIKGTKLEAAERIAAALGVSLESLQAEIAKHYVFEDDRLRAMEKLCGLIHGAFTQSYEHLVRGRETLARLKIKVPMLSAFLERVTWVGET